ncbi:hypothetical protein BGZ91_003620 [Linnemannia elongata]|nr:hypothetical protein BGZ91_003620 [Linnemannia elongata]
MDIQHEVTMLKVADRHTHLVEYLGIIENPIGPCLLFELCLSNNLNSPLSNRGAITKEEETRVFQRSDRNWVGPLAFGCIVHIPYPQGKEACLIDGRTTYPTKLERALEKGECKLKPDAKGLVRLVLDFDSKNRSQLTSLRREKFFKLGYCPTILSEDVFKGKPDLTTDGKRKAIRQSRTRKSTRRPSRTPYCDLAIHCNTDSCEADF